MQPINLNELEELARDKLAGMVYDYYRSGAHDEITLRENHAAYGRIRLAYRVLAGVAERDLSTEVLGRRLSMPVLVAPTAFHRMAHPDGEVATARAAGAEGTIMILSTLSNSPIEEVVAASAGEVWFQLYVYKDRGATQALVERAERAGVRAIVVTVDAPLLGRRERDVKNRFRLPDGLDVANVTAEGYGAVPRAEADSGLAAYFDSLLDPGITWRDLDWLRSITELPILVKGVVRGDDAVRAAEHGARGLVVSNHGGRQLDTSPATIEALPDVVEALVAHGAPEGFEVLLDGGVRRGTDVVKALALGARAVLLGRPVLWGLAWNGEAGVRHALDLLREEIDLAMTLCGCASVGAIDRDLIRGLPATGKG